MSDAVCGPSNALQQFKQQTQHDRSLQQDRIANRQHPAQGFRSADPNAGLLDPEFEAFQAGRPAPDFPQFQHYQHAPQPFQQPYQEPGPAPSWASDFQQMSLASPPPMQQQQQQYHAAGPSTANWAQGFRESIAQNAPRAQNSSPSPYAFQQRARFGMNGFQNNFAQPALTPATQAKGKEPATEQYDEAAFERAFDMASEDLMEDTAPAAKAATRRHSLDQAVDTPIPDFQEAHGVSKANVQEMQDVLDREHNLAHETREHRHPDLSLLEQMRMDGLMSEPLQEAQQEPEQTANKDDDALAATAHELLEKLEHNKTEKFRNSQFLGLMRKLRDREVKVDGDQMVETVSPAHPTRILTPDSGYESSSSPTTPPNPSVCKVIPRSTPEESRWDHWESPYT